MGHAVRAGKRSKALMFAMLALLAMASPDAMAIPSFFTPVGGDKSLNSFLIPIFGPLFGSSGGSTPLMALFGIFNAAALTIGGILAAYTLVAGTMQTAHDGEMLGKRWSSMWLPIRTTLGVGLVVPVSSGYCVAQLIVGWLAMQGIGLADQLWSGFSSAAFTQNGMSPTAVTPNVNALATTMLKSMVCMAQGNKNNASSAEASNMNGGSYAASDYSVAMGDASGSGMVYETPVTGRAYGYAGNSICGVLNFDSISAPNTDSSAFNGITTSNADRATATTAILNAHKTAALAMEGALMPLAQQLVTDGSTPNVTIIASAANAYQASVSAAATGLFGTGDAALAPIRATAASDGWIMAGAWFMRIAALQDQMNKATSGVPSMQAPSKSNQVDANFKPAYDRLDGFLSNNPTTIGFNKAYDKQENDAKNSDDTMLSVKYWIRKFSKGLTGWFQIDPNRHPVMAAKDLGDNVMLASEAGMIGAAAASIVNGMAGTIILSMSLPMFAFGAALSVYTPMIPFIVFFGAAMGWILLVAEAVIAAPLWAVMHLTPSGDDIMGGARQGYMMLLGLLLRPALLIFGFAICLVAIDPVMKFYNMVFFPVFFSSMGDSMVGIFSSIVGLGIYFGSFTFFMHKIFGLIHVIPDQLMSWIGGSGSQLGSYGEGASKAGQATKLAAANAIGQMGGTLNNAAANMANNKRNNELQKTGNEKSENAMMLGKAESARAGGAMAGAAASEAAATHDGAMATGSPGELAQSVRENSSAASNVGQKQEKLMQGAAAAESRAENMRTKTPEEARAKAELMDHAQSMKAEAQGLNSTKTQAESNAKEAFASLSGNAQSSMPPASGATLAAKNKAISANRTALNAARAITQSNPELAAAIGAEASASTFEAALEAIEATPTIATEGEGGVGNDA